MALVLYNLKNISSCKVAEKWVMIPIHLASDDLYLADRKVKGEAYQTLPRAGLWLKQLSVCQENTS